MSQFLDIASIAGDGGDNSTTVVLTDMGGNWGEREEHVVRRDAVIFYKVKTQSLP